MADVPEEASPVPVACLTKDFAMQNVMINAGITLLALSGKVIKRARTHVLWCGSCYAYVFVLIHLFVNFVFTQHGNLLYQILQAHDETEFLLLCNLRLP